MSAQINGINSSYRARDRSIGIAADRSGVPATFVVQWLWRLGVRLTIHPAAPRASVGRSNSASVAKRASRDDLYRCGRRKVYRGKPC